MQLVTPEKIASVMALQSIPHSGLCMGFWRRCQIIFNSRTCDVTSTPLDVSMTEIGARRVEELLWKLYYGLAA